MLALRKFNHVPSGKDEAAWVSKGPTEALILVLERCYRPPKR